MIRYVAGRNKAVVVSVDYRMCVTVNYDSKA